LTIFVANTSCGLLIDQFECLISQTRREMGLTLEVLGQW